MKKNKDIIMTKIRQKIVIAILALILIVSAIVTLNSTLRKAAAVSPDYSGPRITVLTPGLGGRASHWSNADGAGGNIFAEDVDSLVRKLRLKGGLAYIFRAHFKEGISSRYDLYSYYSDTKKTIIDASKHIIIVFDSENSNASNAVVYSEFKYMLNDVIKQVETLDHGRPTKVNLIGHSRGGITNLQYALDHPNKVHTMISIGTPYFGSVAAEKFGSLILGESDGLNDINNAALYNSYYQRWTDGYESKYKNINSIAIGSTTTVVYQKEVLQSIGGGFSAPLAKMLEMFENALIQNLAYTILYNQYPKLKEQYPVLEMFTREQFADIGTVINNEVHFGEWYSDVLVPVASQQGISENKNYYFTKHTKKFNREDSSLTPKRSTTQIAVIHNIEVYDSDIHNYILSKIIMNDGQEADNEISNVARPTDDVWSIKIRNNHSTGRTYAYNSKMCFEDDAKNWKGLKDIKYIWLDPNTSTIVDIAENFAATHIAVSSISNGARHIKYADGLFANYGAFKMSIYDSTNEHGFYSKHGLDVSIICKVGYVWTLDVTNNTGSTKTIEYNSRMCYKNDASHWNGLKNEKSKVLANGETCQLTIQENYSADGIAISYVMGSSRYIFYANNLDEKGTMTAYSSTRTGSTVVLHDEDPNCIAEGSLITLADGSQKAVEELTGDEMLLVWNLQTGAFDVAPILFIDSDAAASYEVINLEFSDGTEVEVIYEHGFWDVTLNRYVYLRNDAADYIGHWFNKQSTNEDGDLISTQVQLTDVDITIEQTTAWSPVTAVHLCYYVNGMLTMPGATEGLVNIFEVDGEAMKYDEEAMAQDIAAYGLFTYEEFSAQVEISQEVFDAFGGQYLKVAIGKGQIDMQTVAALLERYSEFLS